MIQYGNAESLLHFLGQLLLNLFLDHERLRNACLSTSEFSQCLSKRATVVSCVLGARGIVLNVSCQKTKILQPKGPGLREHLVVVPSSCWVTVLQL